MALILRGTSHSLNSDVPVSGQDLAEVGLQWPCAAVGTAGAC
jgi:hypothetical protein